MMNYKIFLRALRAIVQFDCIVYCLSLNRDQSNKCLRSLCTHLGPCLREKCYKLCF